jgi:AcrR family transcriptional regulator
VDKKNKPPVLVNSVSKPQIVGPAAMAALPAIAESHLFDIICLNVCFLLSLPSSNQSRSLSMIAPVKDDLIQQQILQAARRLFEVHGFHKVTMDDVAKAMGKGRSSLYYYYKSKDEISDAVMELEISEMLTAIARAVDKVPNAAEKINAFCITKLKVMQEKIAFFKSREAGLDADTMSHFKKKQIEHHCLIIKQESALLKQILLDGISNNELRPMAEKEMETLIFVILSSLHGMKREMIIENSFKKIRPAVDTFTSLVMNGIKK